MGRLEIEGRTAMAVLLERDGPTAGGAILGAWTG